MAFSIRLKRAAFPFSVRIGLVAYRVVPAGRETKLRAV